MIYEYLDNRILPEDKTLRIMLEQDILIRRGYSKEYLDSITIAEYEILLFMTTLLENSEKQEKAKSFGGI